MKRAKIWCYAVMWVTLGITILSTSCTKQKALSDKELAQIFHDAFLSNAYTASNNLRLDSLRLYEPIFEKYGYTTQDVQYTIGSFATRKSARLGDVVERAILMLEVEGIMLDREVTVLDTIDQIAKRRTADIVYADSLIEMQSWRDTSDIKIILSDIREGTYDIQFNYMVDDSLSSVDFYKFETWSEIRKKDGKSITYTKHDASSTLLSKEGAMIHSKQVSVKPNHDRLVIQLAMPENKAAKKTTIKRSTTTSKKETEERVTTPSIKIKNLTIKYIHSAQEAREILYQEMVPLTIFDYALYPIAPTDSL